MKQEDNVIKAGIGLSLPAIVVVAVFVIVLLGTKK